MDAQVLALLLGALIGLTLALTGAGGGILAVPLLVFGLHLSVPQAAPVALVAVGLAAALGAGLALRAGQLRYRAAALIGVSGVLVAPAGIVLAHRLPTAPLALLFSGVLAYVALRTLREARRPANAASLFPPEDKLPCVLDPEQGRLQWTAPCARALMRTGVLSGLLSGALGVGGGFVIVPALARYTNLDQRSVVGTSLGVIALVSAGSVTAAAVSGRLLWEVALPFATGSALGILLGRGLARRISGPGLRHLFALVSLVAAVSLALKTLGY